MSESYAIILCGGSGTRLWPLSTRSRPKQLLKLAGEDSLLQQTVRRALSRVKPANVLTVTHADYFSEVSRQLAVVHPDAARGIHCEPMARNTLPAISWLAAVIAAQDPAARVAVFPSDHVIQNAETFLKSWELAERGAESGRIALMSVTPDRAATDFGYIRVGDVLQQWERLSLNKVLEFVEKPDARTAESFLRSGNYAWNAGIFLFRAGAFLELVSRHQPAVARLAKDLARTGAKRASAEAYGAMTDISIDYGLMEKIDDAVVVPADIGWNDVGNWQSLYENQNKDGAGNASQGDALFLDSRGNFVWAENAPVIAFGLQDAVIVQTAEATLVTTRQSAGRLKDVVGHLKTHRPELLDVTQTVLRPWGSFSVIQDAPAYKLKKILVNPGQTLSLQSHKHRSEHWVVVAGRALVQVGEDRFELTPNQSVFIPQGARHRLANPCGTEILCVIEVQIGSYLGEDDIERYEDAYGRV